MTLEACPYPAVETNQILIRSGGGRLGHLPCNPRHLAKDFCGKDQSTALRVKHPAQAEGALLLLLKGPAQRLPTGCPSEPL